MGGLKKTQYMGKTLGKITENKKQNEMQPN